jgi:hypothetical protein
MDVSRTQILINIGEDVGKKEPSFTTGGKVIQNNGKSYGGSLKN